jgi:hypothetical protein
MYAQPASHLKVCTSSEAAHWQGFAEKQCSSKTGLSMSSLMGALVFRIRIDFMRIRIQLFR